MCQWSRALPFRRTHGQHPTPHCSFQLPHFIPVPCFPPGLPRRRRRSPLLSIWAAWTCASASTAAGPRHRRGNRKPASVLPHIRGHGALKSQRISLAYPRVLPLFSPLFSTPPMHIRYGAKPPSSFPPPQVNTAARMETTSEPGRVHLSESAANLLLQRPADDLHLVARGSRTIKGKVRQGDTLPPSVSYCGSAALDGARLTCTQINPSPFMPGRDEHLLSGGPGRNTGTCWSLAVRP